MSLNDKPLPSEQGIYTLLGFAQKAGKLTSGSDAVRLQLAKGGVRLVLLAGDLSENSLESFWKSFERLPKHRRAAVDVWRFGSKQDLGIAAGKPARGVWALADESFCRGLTDKLNVLVGVAPERAALLHRAEAAAEQPVQQKSTPAKNSHKKPAQKIKSAQKIKKK